MKTVCFSLLLGALLLNSGLSFAGDRVSVRPSTARAKPAAHYMSFALKGQPGMSGERQSALFSGTIENKGISKQVAITIKEADAQTGSFIRVTPHGTGTTVALAGTGFSAAGIAAVPKDGAIVGAVINAGQLLKGKASGPVTLVKPEALTKAAKKIAASYGLKEGQYKVQPQRVEIVGLGDRPISLDITAEIVPEKGNKVYPVNLTGTLKGNPAQAGAKLSVQQLKPGNSY